jgi:pilus assembly protein Flp/PilA
MIEMMKKFLMEEDGVTAIEYSLIAALIAIIIVGAVTAAGTNLNLLYSDVATKVSEVASLADE